MAILAVLDRLTKGAILIGWIVLLIFLGMHALQQNAKGLLETYLCWAVPQTGEVVQRSPGRGSNREADPLDLLDAYLDVSHPLDPPPMSTILETLLPNPVWSDYNEFSESLSDAERLEFKAGEEYLVLFRRVSSELDAIIADRDIAARDATVEPATVTGVFGILKPDEPVPLPKRAVIWVERQRDLADAEAKRQELVNTFLLVIVLGAFGSLIFLVRTFVGGEKQEGGLTMAAYLFRPVLGLLLAMALFLIDLLLQTVVSTADVTDMRPEPLLMLALAAGLLSEQAYELVQFQAETALARYRKRREEAEA